LGPTVTAFEGEEGERKAFGPTATASEGKKEHKGCAAS
jgi:hypothetical protein